MRRILRDDQSCLQVQCTPAAFRRRHRPQEQLVLQHGIDTIKHDKTNCRHEDQGGLLRRRTCSNRALTCSAGPLGPKESLVKSFVEGTLLPQVGPKLTSRRKSGRYEDHQKRK
jgi:hypothetical protein